jgi:hypothetical protein
VLLGAAVVIATFVWNIQKYVIITATSVLGAGVIIGTLRTRSADCRWPV